MNDDPLQAALWCVHCILEIRALTADVWPGGREMGELDAAIELQLVLSEHQSIPVYGGNLCRQLCF